MKRLVVGSVLIGLTLLLYLACSSDETEDCRDIGGDYNVTKNLSSVSCYGVTVQNSATVIPSTSTLNIEQAVCSLLATEDIPGQDVQIPYTGSIEDDDQFTLEIENPETVPIPLQLNIEGVGSISCRFKGSIKWQGERQSNGSLSGQITETLEKSSDENNPACPASCSLQMSFAASQ